MNVASRLEALTRELGVALVVSQDLIDTVDSESPMGHPDLHRLVPAQAQQVRGREATITIWVLKSADDAT